MKITNQRRNHRLPLLAFIDKFTQIALLQKLDLAHHDLKTQTHLIVVRPFGPIAIPARRDSSRIYSDTICDIDHESV